MGAPTINLPQSLFILPHWQEVVIQPYSDTATWWELAGELPPGFVFDAGSGGIFGNGMVPGVWMPRIVAANAAGRTSKEVTIGVYEFGEKKILQRRIFIDLSTWEVRLTEVVQRQQPNASRHLFYATYGDRVSFRIHFVNRPDGAQGHSGYSPAGIDIDNMAFSIKGLDTEPLFLFAGDAAFLRREDGSCDFEFVFQSQELLSFLDDVEADTGTERDCICEFQFFFKRYGEETYRDVFTTKPFVVRMVRSIFL
jgi:hypothetical protein